MNEVMKIKLLGRQAGRHAGAMVVEGGQVVVVVMGMVAESLQCGSTECHC